MPLRFFDDQDDGFIPAGPYERPPLRPLRPTVFDERSLVQGPVLPEGFSFDLANSRRQEEEDLPSISGQSIFSTTGGGGAQAPAHRRRALTPSDFGREEPEFDRKRSRLLKILTGVGVGAGTIGALAGAPGLLHAGSGLAQGGAEGLEGLREDYDQERRGYEDFLTHLQGLNISREDAAQAAHTERQQELEDYQRGRRDTISDDKTKHERELEEIKAREAADLAAQKELREYINQLPITEKDKQQLEINLMNARANQSRAGTAAQREGRLATGTKSRVTGKTMRAEEQIDTDILTTTRQLKQARQAVEGGDEFDEPSAADQRRVIQLENRLIELSQEKQELGESQQASQTDTDEIGDARSRQAGTQGVIDVASQEEALRQPVGTVVRLGGQVFVVGQ